jgi:Fe-S cluster biogenesis protein NfuA
MAKAGLLALVMSLTLVACGGKTELGPDDASVDALADSSGDAIGDAKPDVADAADFTSCGKAGDCLLAITGCCAECGTAPLTSYAAIRRDASNAYRDAVCPVPTPCPKCMTNVDPAFTAVCRGARCQAVDLRTDAMSACTKDSDCTLRFPGCCESCGGDASTLLAVSKAGTGEYQQQICETPAPACPPCIPVYPDKAFAACDPTTKHCVVRLAP